MNFQKYHLSHPSYLPALFSYDIKTQPGMTDDYYVVAISKTGSYNTSQPEDQKIRLEVPSMEYPAGFKGAISMVGGINIKLNWEPIAINNSWYSGYLIEKKTITGTVESEWRI